MLASVTRKFSDLSTPDSFEFSFYCDRCGKEWRSEIYIFCLKGFELPMDDKIRSMLWNQQHEEAYERANREAGIQFSRCTTCGRRVCDDCCDVASRENAIICKGCGSA